MADKKKTVAPGWRKVKPKTSEEVQAQTGIKVPKATKKD